MAVVIACTRERRADDPRVAITPDTAKKLIAAGAVVRIEAGAGAGSSIPDETYREAGAEVVKDVHAALDGADVLLKVRGTNSMAKLVILALASALTVSASR